VASTGEAETRISACSRCGFDVVLPTGPPRFLRECLRLKDYEIYGFAVLAADRAWPRVSPMRSAEQPMIARCHPSHGSGAPAG
jgi:hypothetical protein